MLTAKQQLKKIVDELPDDCSFEDVQYPLYVTDLIRARLEEEKKGEFASQEEIEKRFREWPKKRRLSGLPPQ